MSVKTDLINLLDTYKGYYELSIEFIDNVINQLEFKSKCNPTIDTIINMTESFISNYDILLRKLLFKFDGSCNIINIKTNTILFIPKYKLKYNIKRGIGKIVFYTYDINKNIIEKSYLIGCKYDDKNMSKSLLLIYISYIIKRYQLLKEYYQFKLDELINNITNLLIII